MKAAESGREGEPADSWQELHEEIARLPRRYREPVVLCYLEGLKIDAAALRIGCPSGTVLSRLSRARSPKNSEKAGRKCNYSLELRLPKIFTAVVS
ncbi:MAG: RNA polymerase sigma factor [Isosphaeraceae bacterium]